MRVMFDHQTYVYELILLRHGESTGNAEKYLQGQGEYFLTDLGKEQAQALADYWKTKQIQFDSVIASPQPRARETAEIIAKVTRNNIEFNPIWKERDHGDLSGKPLDEVRHLLEYPAVIQMYEPIGKTGESEWAFYQRGVEALQSILTKPPGKYLIVSHGGILNMCLKAILGIAPQVNFQGPRFKFDNTAYASLSYFPESHVWYINGLNERPHWLDKG